MKVAFVGKGGSGKTTLASLLSRSLAAQNVPVLAIDADINQHLGVALGLSEEEASTIPPMGLEVDRIKEYVRGTNARIPSAALMIKTTPPGQGSRLLCLGEANPLFSYFERHVQGVRLMATGPFSQEDLGHRCYHSKVGAAEIVLNHLIDGPDEYVVVDMTAGADSFASGMCTKFDLTFLVVEPTRKSLSVYKQYQAYARDYAIKLAVIGNKVESGEDRAFLQEQVGSDLLAWVERSAYVRAMEKGAFLSLDQLEAHNRQAFEIVKHTIDGCEKDWEKFYRQTLEFHRKNALDWANASAGEDLTRQIDPTFSLGTRVDQLWSSLA